ncbi:sigma-70 family RNA polymerase sigma factor [Amycolatopsis cihanbeyliensis]|uniref:RNA polymerase sigma factor n=1 Tax=Amycolatopsis cihanbeyliensis TaxID=1128664 RepID=A0A542DI82_AMYCI|nr:sigma-70 family RNA polymerase sigma factor [Amycolatopsis cihanbeyliensis]TQJ02802.1 RNA polymerase ECF family sigma subunit [Amycolatopsis cihanbeyliensis]
MATGTVTDDFPQLADPYRRELLAHCYRMLGSVHEAEDLVQETYLRAWRGYPKFEGRSSLRTWLYRIATSACLTALERTAKRPLPTGLGGPSAEAQGTLVKQDEVSWLEPIPDAMAGAEADDPAGIVTERESIRLALIAALQYLPPRQRAVLVLRDVLKWRATEVAELFETSTAAVNSILQRARAQLERVAPTEDTVVDALTAEQRALLDRYVTAFEAKDVAGLVALCTEDVVWEMPPYTAWYQGTEHVGLHLSTTCPAGPGDLRLVPFTANGQPAFAQYLLDPGTGAHHAFNVQVLTVGPAAISRVVTFMDPELFPAIGLPRTQPARPEPLVLPGAGQP